MVFRSRLSTVNNGRVFFQTRARLAIRFSAEGRIDLGSSEQRPEAPVSSEFLSLLRISEFFGFQWQKLAEILSLFKLYNNLGKVAVRVKLWLIIYCGHLVEWIVK